LFLTAWPYVQDKATDPSANIAFLKRAESKLFHGVLQCLDHLAVDDTLWVGEHCIILRPFSSVRTFPEHILLCVALYIPLPFVFTRYVSHPIAWKEKTFLIIFIYSYTYLVDIS
jgi:hypothetical protein